LLLTLIVFAVGILRSRFTPEWTRRILLGRRETVGKVLAALLAPRDAILVPFGIAVVCRVRDQRSAVGSHVFISFFRTDGERDPAGAALRVVRLESGGLVCGPDLIIAIFSGWVIGRLRMDKHVEAEVAKFGRNSN
jgi:hypothetical protein